MAKTDEEKATFMREVGATHAVWDSEGELIELTLGAPRSPGPAARMADFHERAKADRVAREHNILFAASSVRPKLAEIAAPSAVPRAVIAKEAAARRGRQG